MADNRVGSSNPHGKLLSGELRKLEEELKTELPTGYRDYLVKHNGGKFEKQNILISGDEGDTKIHHMFGLNHGPDYQQLHRKYSLSKEKLPEYLPFWSNSANYLPICDDGLGNVFYIKVKGYCRGAVYFSDHEKPGRHPLVRVSASFEDFIEKMKSDEELDREFKQRDPEGFAAFQKELEKMKALRRREVAAMARKKSGKAAKKAAAKRPKGSDSKF